LRFAVSHLIAYVGNEPENMACALFSARGALYSRGERRDGWGLGFVQGGDVLLQKRPRADTGEVDLYNLVKDLRADAVVGRVGFGAEGNTTAEDADPFRFRSWLFGSVGEVSETGFESVRDKLLESVPDFLRRNIRGRSPGELVFHLFLAFLHDAGSLDAPSPSPSLVHGALRNSVAFLDRLLVGGGSPTAPSRLALVATNGRCLVAANGAHPMRYLPIEGISDCPVCHSRLDREPDDRRLPHESLRAVIFEANRSIEERGGWQNVAEGSVVIVGPDRVPVVSPL
jgi:Glutamine amidotransferases class-II